MDVESLFPVVVPGFFLSLILAERLRPARPLPRVPGWRLLGVVALVVTGAVSSAVPLLYQDLVRAHRLLDLEWMGLLPGTAIAFLATELTGYWFHRGRHAVTPLWRIHQLHHSAERVDVFGSAFFHPLDIAGEGLVGSLTATLLLGIAPEAAALAGLASVCLSLFQHANLRTPRWLGYLVQRPESHSVHHARGVHAWNYGLPLWDMAFGTFENPERFEAEAGFYQGASRRLGAMLALRDVTRPPRSGRSALAA